MKPRTRRPPEDTVAAAQAWAAKMLSRREHGRRELAAKMEQRGFSPDVVGAALAALSERGWLDEARFAASVARHRCLQGRGPRWVEAELQAQGLADADIQAALEQPELDWREACQRAARRLKASDPVARQRQKLYQRGFDADIIAAYLASDSGE